ncbi:MAG: ABC transporter permease subunit [Acidimicrobiales bacterium]|nr:ABC transporter permease subunit [Acidimicrobiales bacterium]
MTARATPQRRALDVLLTVGLLALVVVAWQAYVRVFDVAPYLLPAPTDVWDSFLDIRGTLPTHVVATVTAAVLGLVVGASVAVVLAVVIASVGLVRRVLLPLLVVSQSIPLVVVAPLLIVWLGFGLAPKVVVVALVVFFPVVVATVEGIDATDRDLLDLVRSMGASRGRVLRSVQIPAALPSFFAGLQVSAAYAMLGAVIAEALGTERGLGLFITRSRVSFQLDQVFVGIALIALVSVALFLAVRLVARLATPWLRP